MAVGRAPAWATGWGIRGHARGALQCGFLAVPCVAKRTGFVPWAAGHLDLFAGREKKVAGPGLEPTTLGSSTQHLNHSDTRARCFGSLHFHSSECAWRFLQLGAGGTRRSAAAARATSDLPKSKWGIAALEVVALGRAPCRVLGSPPGARGTTRRSTSAPRGAVCSVASSRGVVASMLSAGAAPRMPDPPPSSCGLLQRGWGFLLRSAAGWGFARRLELSPIRMEPSPRSVPLSACGRTCLLCARPFLRVHFNSGERAGTRIVFDWGSRCVWPLRWLLVFDFSYGCGCLVPVRLPASGPACRRGLAAESRHGG